MRGSVAVSIEVRVRLKPGILDAEAESVAKSLGLLGIGHIASVRTEKLYRLRFEGVSREEALRLAREAVDRLLANPVVHEVEVSDLGP